MKSDRGIHTYICNLDLCDGASSPTVACQRGVYWIVKQHIKGFLWFRRRVRGDGYANQLGRLAGQKSNGAVRADIIRSSLGGSIDRSETNGHNFSARRKEVH